MIPQAAHYLSWDRINLRDWYHCWRSSEGGLWREKRSFIFSLPSCMNSAKLWLQELIIFWPCKALSFGLKVNITDSKFRSTALHPERMQSLPCWQGLGTRVSAGSEPGPLTSAASMVVLDGFIKIPFKNRKVKSWPQKSNNWKLFFLKNYKHYINYCIRTRLWYWLVQFHDPSRILKENQEEKHRAKANLVLCQVLYILSAPSVWNLWAMQAFIFFTCDYFLSWQNIKWK